MEFLTTIYIVTIERLDQTLQSRMWYWDRYEAMTMYEGIIDQYDDERIATVYSIDVQDTINERVDELMVNRHSISGNRAPLEELRSNRKAAEADDVTWGDLNYHPEGFFLIERLKASTSEYWGFHVEPYNVGDINEPGAWRVIDTATDVPMAIIRHTENAFKVIVNGYSRTETFAHLKAAVIYAVGEFNG